MGDSNSIPAALSLLLAAVALMISGCASLGQPSVSAYRYVLEADKGVFQRQSKQNENFEEHVAASVPVIKERLKLLGVLPNRIRLEGIDRIVLEVPADHERDALESALGIPAELKFALVDDNTSPVRVSEGAVRSRTAVIPMAAGGPPIIIEEQGGIEGRYVRDAISIIDPVVDEPALLIRFDDEGAKMFAKMTEANIGRQIAIVIEGQVISAPYIFEPILGGEVQVIGGFTREKANELAIMISSGALPAPFRIVEMMPIE